MSYQRLQTSADSRLDATSKLSRKITLRGRFVVVGFSLLLLAGSLGILHIRLRPLSTPELAFSPPLTPQPLPVAESYFPVASSPTTLDDLKLNLQARLESIGLRPSKLECQFGKEEEMRYDELRNGQRIFIALNLYNSEAILPSLGGNLLDLADVLGDVAISIFENGSTDRTPEALSHLAAVLSYANVSHSIRIDRQRTDWSRVHRIEQVIFSLCRIGFSRIDLFTQLAIYRNEALSPLNSTFDTLLFINDVFFCPSDALELLLQRRIQHADAVCGLDWIPGSLLRYFGFGTVKFYDNCQFARIESRKYSDDFAGVARSITGELVRSRSDTFTQFRDGFDELFPAAQDIESRSRLRNLEPIPVFSCWNGMIALDTRPLLGVELDGRISADGPVRFRSAVNSVGECGTFVFSLSSAALIRLINSGFGVSDSGFGLLETRIQALAGSLRDFDFDFADLHFEQMIPTVAVTYDESTYGHSDLVNLRSSRTNYAVVDWDEVKDPESVVCYRWQPGDHFPRTTVAPWIA